MCLLFLYFMLNIIHFYALLFIYMHIFITSILFFCMFCLMLYFVYLLISVYIYTNITLTPLFSPCRLLLRIMSGHIEQINSFAGLVSAHFSPGTKSNMTLCLFSCCKWFCKRTGQRTYFAFWSSIVSVYQ